MIVGVYVKGWIICPRVVTDDGVIRLHRDHDKKMSIGASSLEMVGLYAY